MRLLILLQILIAVIKISKTEDSSRIISFDSQTETSGEQVETPNDGNPKQELFDSLTEIESDGNDLDFDYDNDEDPLKVGMKNTDMKEQEMQEILLKAMKKPAIRKQIGEVIPILRVMSPAQRLTLAALVSSQIMSQNTLSEENLTEMAAMFANKHVENPNDRHNITEQLLLPISMDIAKMFKGLGKEMGRNLRQNFYKPVDSFPVKSTVRRITRKPAAHRQAPPINRRMDEFDYEDSEGPPLTEKAVAEALKQPGKDECDYFTKSLCLEVTNYPTEAIILSLKNNQDIAKTFLTDFDVRSTENDKHDSKNQSNGRRLERRQDDPKEVQDLASDGYVCLSSVKYARPKRARTTSGQWKYIVNAGDYTQTLRLEICQKPKSPCSFVTNHLNSECTQIFNYHRLLTWDEGKGLHMDIFKVPSCCSCHIQGYSTFYPPNKDIPFLQKRKEPLEGSETVPETQNLLPYGYLGNKREVPKDIPKGTSLPIKNQTQIFNSKDFYRNPVDHLVPPGPPLPLENENAFNPYAESGYNQKKISQEQNRKYPPQAEYRRIVQNNKATEIVDSFQDVTLSSSNRLKAPVLSIPERSNLKFSKPHLPDVVAIKPEGDFSNKIRYPNPSPSSSPPFPYEIVRDQSVDGVVYITPGPPKDLIYSSGPKITSKQPAQLFKPEFVDNKSLPSRVNPSYVTPPKVKGIESRVSTTSLPPKKSESPTTSGQKKINYNYHPIIDFFLADPKKRQLTYSSPQYIPLASQDWTPVVGH